MRNQIAPPRHGEYAPFYAGYVDRVAARPDLLYTLATQAALVRSALAPLPEAEVLRRYEPGKWSVKEVIGHLCDAERIFAYRALRIARGDATPLPGFDENAYVAAARFDRLPIRQILDEFGAVREATLAFFRSVRPGEAARRGTASGAEVSVRALGFIIAGHTEHHLQGLRERYGIAGLDPAPGEPIHPSPPAGT